jgi:hypothetical protein
MAAANLVTRSDLHPAVVDLLLDVAKETQRGLDPVARLAFGLFKLRPILIQARFKLQSKPRSRLPDQL